jgi:hypothetical protein
MNIDFNRGLKSNCNKEGDEFMKRISASVSAIVLAGSLLGSAYAADGVLLKDEAAENYCHMKFAAIRPRTLASDDPQAKSASTGDVIDYYGDCNESPTDKDQVLEQKHDEEFSFGRAYEDGD